MKEKPPTCHPERKHLARGLCCSCYSSLRRSKEFTPTRQYSKPGPAKCHPDRKARIRGLCEDCYNERVKGAATCSHPERKQKGAGVCASCYQRLLGKINPEFAARRKAYKAGWHQRQKDKPTYPEKLAQKKARMRLYQVMQAYGLTATEYEAFLDSHAHVCDICGSGERLHIDHDHATGKLRGLLCRFCNLMLGHAKDDKERLRLGIEYLERHAQIQERKTA